MESIIKYPHWLAYLKLAGRKIVSYGLHKFAFPSVI